MKSSFLFLDLNTSSPDKKSILMYVMCLFQSLSSNPPSKKSPPPRPVSIALGGYQASLEEVLTWLLGAEDKLSTPTPCPKDLPTARRNFHEYNTFIQELSVHQESVVTVLEEGAVMLASGGLCEDDAQEIRLQMQLLESRWESLRTSAMDEQTNVNERLMEAQRAEILRIQNWLEKIEANIARLAMTSGSLDIRLQDVRLLCTQISAEEANIKAIRQLDIVDESRSEEGKHYLHSIITSIFLLWFCNHLEVNHSIHAVYHSHIS